MRAAEKPAYLGRPEAAHRRSGTEAARRSADLRRLEDAHGDGREAHRAWPHFAARGPSADRMRAGLNLGRNQRSGSNRAGRSARSTSTSSRQGRVQRQLPGIEPRASARPSERPSHPEKRGGCRGFEPQISLTNKLNITHLIRLHGGSARRGQKSPRPTVPRAPGICGFFDGVSVSADTRAHFASSHRPDLPAGLSRDAWRFRRTSSLTSTPVRLHFDRSRCVEVRLAERSGPERPARHQGTRRAAGLAPGCQFAGSAMCPGSFAPVRPVGPRCLGSGSGHASRFSGAFGPCVLGSSAPVRFMRPRCLGSGSAHASRFSGAFGPCVLGSSTPIRPMRPRFSGAGSRARPASPVALDRPWVHALRLVPPTRSP